MNYGQLIVPQIDAQVEREQEEDGLRTHLGGSAIGGECMREVWFGFRWAHTEQFEGRMLRLFARGHKAEDTFADLLRGLGAKVWTTDPDTGKQIRISAFGGHYGGATDGVAVGLPMLPPEVPPGAPVLLEMKTHNDKSFKDLLKQGLCASKPKHYKQAQTYMHHTGIKFCLYMAVNKNTDELWCWFFAYDPVMGQHLTNRAETIIFGEGIPPRISEHASWFKCKFCAMAGVCHGSAMPLINCRTCFNSVPQPDGTWTCKRGNQEIQTTPKTGCGEHFFHPVFFVKATCMAVDFDAKGPCSATYRTLRGETLSNGKDATPSTTFSLLC